MIVIMMSNKNGGGGGDYGGFKIGFHMVGS